MPALRRDRTSTGARFALLILGLLPEDKKEFRDMSRSLALVAALIVGGMCVPASIDSMPVAKAEGARWSRDGRPVWTDKVWYGLHFTSAGQILRHGEGIVSSDRDGKGPTGFVLLARQGDDDGPSPTDVKRPPKFYNHDLASKRCIVQTVKLVYNGKADKPLTTPKKFSAPQPGQNSDNVGPSNGPEPNSNPQEYFTGNVFEYHSDLNGNHGCSSEQFALAWFLQIDRTNGTIGSVDGDGLDERVLNGESPWKVDRYRPGGSLAHLPPDSIFKGDTRSNTKPAIDGGTYYEGTPKKIHWLDTPGWLKQADQQSSNAAVLVALIKSVTYDSDAQGGKSDRRGWFCYSGHTVVVDLSTGQAMDAAAARTMFDSANNKNKIPRGKEASDDLRTSPNDGGFAGTTNPEFKDLGCYQF